MSKFIKFIVERQMPLQNLSRSNPSSPPLVFTSPIVSPLPHASSKIESAVLDFRSYCLPGKETDLSTFLYQSSKTLAKQAARNCRIVALTTTAHSATHASMVEGLVRSLSKELAGRGGVMNMVNVMNESEGNIAACEFFTSGKSAFINGQRVNVQQPDEESLKFYESRARGTAVVTGAARGIGFETAKEMLSLGFDIYGVDHPAGDFGALESLGVKGVLKLDVTDDNAGNKIGEGVGCDLDVMIHAAGITRDKSMKRMSSQLWRDVLNVNLFSIQRIDQQLIEDKGYKGGARIVGVSSTSGIAGNIGQGNYATSKSGLMGYAEDMNGRHPEYTFNNVAPGFIQTDMTSNLPLVNEVVATRILTPLKAAGRPEDVAGAIGWLGVGGMGIRGQTLRVCGGMMVGR